MSKTQTFDGFTVFTLGEYGCVVSTQYTNSMVWLASARYSNMYQYLFRPVYCRIGNFYEQDVCVLVRDIILRKYIFAFLAASV